MMDYVNTSAAIRCKYPSDWMLKEGLHGSVVLFFAPVHPAGVHFRENVNIMREDLTYQPLTLDQYQDSTIRSVQQLFSNVKVQEMSIITFAQNPGRRLMYTGNKDQFSMKFLQVWTINDDRVFILSYVAEEVKYAVFLPQVERMIESFEII